MSRMQGMRVTNTFTKKKCFKYFLVTNSAVVWMTPPPCQPPFHALSLGEDKKDPRKPIPICHFPTFKIHSGRLYLLWKNENLEGLSFLGLGIWGEILNYMIFQRIHEKKIKGIPSEIKSSCENAELVMIWTLVLTSASNACHFLSRKVDFHAFISWSKHPLKSGWKEGLLKSGHLLVWPSIEQEASGADDYPPGSTPFSHNHCQNHLQNHLQNYCQNHLND